MSLFPAYSKKVVRDNEVVEDSTSKTTVIGLDSSWLTNSSFSGGHVDTNSKLCEHEARDLPECSTKKGEIKKDECYRIRKHRVSESASDIELSSDSSEHTSRNRHKKMKTERMSKKKKKKREKDKVKNKSKLRKSQKDVLKEVEGLFYTDTKREVGNLLVKTLSRPAIPLYHLPRRRLILSKDNVKRKKINSKKYRYYAFEYENASNVMENETCEDKGFTGNVDVNINIEKEITDKTRYYNEKLESEPNNIEIWFQYIAFQDNACCTFETRKTSKSALKKNIIKKKISILEKAISMNPSSEDLLNEKFRLAELVYPPEQLMNEAMSLINKDRINLTLWRTVIRCSQFSLAKCTAPGVLNAFGNALEWLHQMRVRHLSNRCNQTCKNITKLLLVLLFECGLFMRQSGLWEQLLVLLKQYLAMNISNYCDDTHELYKLDIIIDEGSVRNAEETILKSNLPLSAIWLRIERLREACHWVPLSADASEESKDSDPQRLVFIEDVKHLIQPVLPSSLNFHLVLVTINLLKVPFLPATHTAGEIISLNEIPYAVDAVENLLPIFYPVGLIPIAKDKYFLHGITDLVTGPQYIKDKAGKYEYLTLIGDIFKSVGKQLQSTESVALYSWYLRFYRLLICVSRIEDEVTYRDLDKKSVKKFIKDKLKEAHFRDELQLYNEYALFERDIGNTEAALNVLLTAIKLRRFTYEKATYVALYRNTVETLLRSDPTSNRKRAIDVLCELVSTNSTEVASDKFKHITVEATSSLSSNSEEMSKELDPIDIMGPHWCVEWIACHSYFLMLTKSVWAASGLVQELIDSLSTSVKSGNMSSYICEGLYEVLIAVLHFHSHETNTSYHVLQDVLLQANKTFPNNFYFLHTMSLIETSAGSAGSPWWKLVSTFMPTSSVLPRFFLIFILRHRISVSIQEGGWSDSSGHNLMTSLFYRLINDETSKRCPLIWRLYLQFISVSKAGYDLKTMFYRSVEECPWVKALYVDAIQLVPENIQEIQDLLIEKELRLHSVMDELEILRSDIV